MRHDHCVACGQSDNLNQHHLVPRSIGGGDDETNLLTLCGSCHAKAHSVQAEWRHSELTRKAIRHKQSQGEYIGGHTPYGFDLVNGELIPDRSKQIVIQQAKRLRESGLSLNAVAKELAKFGILSNNNKVFEATQIKRMVTSKEQPK